MSLEFPIHPSIPTAVNPAYALLELLDAANVPGGTILERVALLILDNERLENRLAIESSRDDLDRMLQSLDDDPWEPLMLIADACLDLGRDAEAAAWGWLALHKHWPAYAHSYWCWVVRDATIQHYPAHGGWLALHKHWPAYAHSCWCWVVPDATIKHYPAHVLPLPLQLAGHLLWPQCHGYPTCREALEAAVTAICFLQESLGSLP